VHPRQFGLAQAELKEVQVAEGAASKDMLLAALENRQGPARDIVALNAGASVYIAGLAGTLAEGVDKARATLASGAARRKLDEFVASTRDV
jgi:anthranilate phosphoribosyltransferase